jgi:hypothetical protein
MTAIQSIAGETYINDINKFDILPNSILSLFKCPITQEYFTMPVCLPSGMIYDKPAIITWLSSHDTDPLTGLKIQPQELKLIPMCNYILCAKCIVVDGEIVKFYNPYGYLADLLNLVYETLDSNMLSDKSYINLADVKPIVKTHIKSMDLRDLFRCDLADAPAIELTNGFNYRYYSFVEILTTCCLTNKQLYKHALLTKHGALIHEQCLIINQSPLSCGNRLSEDSHKVLDVKPVVCLDMLEVQPADDFKLTTDIMTKDVSTLDDAIINIHECKRPSRRIYISIEKQKVFTNWYLNCKSSEEHMYIKYSSYVPTAFIKSRLQEFYKQITSGGESTSIIAFKNALQIPNVENIYVSDFSYMTITPTKYFDRYNKMTYFCFSHFDNVVICSASFECCNFTGATGKIIFIGCKFGTSNDTTNTFYKSSLEMRFLNCEFSKESAAALPDKYKSMFE